MGLFYFFSISLSTVTNQSPATITTRVASSERLPIVSNHDERYSSQWGSDDSHSCIIIILCLEPISRAPMVESEYNCVCLDSSVDYDCLPFREMEL